MCQSQCASTATSRREVATHLGANHHPVLVSVVHYSLGLPVHLPNYAGHGYRVVVMGGYWQLAVTFKMRRLILLRTNTYLVLLICMIQTAYTAMLA